LTVEGLARVLRELMHDDRMKAAAAGVARQISREDGIREAVALILAAVNRPHDGRQNTL
jgi:hypothetical protein